MSRPNPLMRVLAVPLMGAVWAYRLTLSPMLGGQCRYEPTCSRYALEALRTHGAWRGSLLTVRRLARCHPFVRGGYDPVPIPDAAHETESAPGILLAPRQAEEPSQSGSGQEDQNEPRGATQGST